MKNSEVLAIANLGKQCAYRSVSNDEAYKLFSLFFKADKLFKSIEEQRVELIKHHSVPTMKDNPNMLDVASKEFQAFNADFTRLLDEEAEIKYKRLGKEAFFAFCKENNINMNDTMVLSQTLLKEEDLDMLANNE